MDWQEYIQASPDILQGKPVFKGTRISLVFVAERLAAGWSHKRLLENYPTLRPEHLQAFYSFIQSGLEDGLIYRT